MAFIKEIKTLSVGIMNAESDYKEKINDSILEIGRKVFKGGDGKVIDVSLHKPVYLVEKNEDVALGVNIMRCDFVRLDYDVDASVALDEDRKILDEVSCMEISCARDIYYAFVETAVNE